MSVTDTVCSDCCVYVMMSVTDTLIKQQLSSLQYVRSVCDTRQQQLSDGVANSDCVLPGVRISLHIMTHILLEWIVSDGIALEQVTHC